MDGVVTPVQEYHILPGTRGLPHCGKETASAKKARDSREESMGLRINTNVQALTAQHRLAKSRDGLEQTLNRLSTGSRIIMAKDDAAGLAISENLRASTRSTNQNIKNAQNGYYLLQTAEGSLNEITNLVIRMKELATQAASDTNGDRERSYIDNEYQALKLEIQRISDTTLYNGRPLLNGTGGVVEIQVGPNNNPIQDRIMISSNFHVDLSTLGIADFSVATAESARETLEPTENAIAKINSTRGEIGAGEARLESAITNLGVYEESLSSAFSQIRDADVAQESSNMARFNILTQAGTSVLAQANAAPQLALKLLA